MRRLVYICDWLPPDFGAVGQYSLAFAREYARAGAAVTLLGLTSASAAAATERCGAGELRIVRLRARPYDRSALLARALWTLSVNARLLFWVLWRWRRFDEIVITGSPPFLLHFFAPPALLLRRRLVYRITDFFPECLMAARPGQSRALAAFYRLTVFLRRRVPAFQVLGEDQRRRLEAIGVAPGRISLKRDMSPVPIDADTQPLPRPPGSAGMTLLLYSGNFGVAHDYQTFLDGYLAHHAGGGRVFLWLNANGAGADALAAALSARGAPFHRSRPVPMDELARLLVTPDAHLVTLKDPFVGFVLPSKIYGCLASRKPILFIGSAASDVHLLGRQAAAPFLHVEQGAPAERVAQALAQLPGAVSSRAARS